MSRVTRALYTRFQQNFIIAQASWKTNALTRNIDHRAAVLLSFPALYLFYRLPWLRRLVIRIKTIRRLYHSIQSK